MLICYLVGCLLVGCLLVAISIITVKFVFTDFFLKARDQANWIKVQLIKEENRL